MMHSRQMLGLSVLEVMLACFIFTTSTLVMLSLLLKQRITLDHLGTQVLQLQLLKNVGAQLSALPCLAQRDTVIAYWQRQVTQILPFHDLNVQCQQASCLICINHTDHEGHACLSAKLAALPCSN